MAITICSSLNEARRLNGFPYFIERTAIINIRPYLTERLEYQYEGEPKQTIFSEGGELSYTTNQEVGQCPTDYAVYIEWLNANTRSTSSYCRKLYQYRDSFGRPYQLVQGAFKGIVLTDFEGNENAGEILAVKFISNSTGQISTKKLQTSSGRFPTARDGCGNYTQQGFDAWALRGTWKVTKIVRLDGQPDNCGDCTFTVTETFSDGTTEIRHQETRGVCPTVQQFEAELGDIQTVTKELKKNEILLVSTGQDTNHPILDYFGDKFNNYLQDNPNHCLVIWGVKDSNNVPFKIAQICSSEGSFPPEIVSIECEKEKCPNNTCEVICNNHICCYNNQGIPVKIINK